MGEDSVKGSSQGLCRLVHLSIGSSYHTVPLFRIDSISSQQTAQTTDLQALRQSTRLMATVLGRVLGCVRSAFLFEGQIDVAVHSYLSDPFAVTTGDLEDGINLLVPRRNHSRRCIRSCAPTQPSGLTLLNAVRYR